MGLNENVGAQHYRIRNGDQNAHFITTIIFWVMSAENILTEMCISDFSRISIRAVLFRFAHSILTSGFN